MLFVESSPECLRYSKYVGDHSTLSLSPVFLTAGTGLLFFLFQSYSYGLLHLYLGKIGAGNWLTEKRTDVEKRPGAGSKPGLPALRVCDLTDRPSLGQEWCFFEILMKDSCRF